MTDFPELDCYLLPGHTRTPADVIDQARAAEQLGIARAWVSERFDVKDAGVICSAALAVTNTLRVATAATNLHIRHPLVLAGMCSSLHHLSGGRFELGLGRGISIRNKMMGLDDVTSQMMIDGVEILRTIWKGGTVAGYEGPLGNLPYLRSGTWMDIDMPIHYVGYGPRSLRLAGEHFDGAHLHTFIGREGLARARSHVQEGAEAAGRDPESVKITAVVASVLEPSREEFLRKIIGRMATYMQAPGYIDTLVTLNGWDMDPVEAFQASPILKEINGAVDSVATLEQIEAIEPLIPPEWLPAATGTPEQVAQYWHDELANGADSVCIHGSTPDEFAPALEAFRLLRSGGAAGSN